MECMHIIYFFVHDERSNMFHTHQHAYICIEVQGLRGVALRAPPLRRRLNTMPSGAMCETVGIAHIHVLLW